MDTIHGTDFKISRILGALQRGCGIALRADHHPLVYPIKVLLPPLALSVMFTTIKIKSCAGTDLRSSTYDQEGFEVFRRSAFSQLEYV